MEISTTVFESKDRGKWPWKFPRQFLNPKTGRMAVEISTTVFDTKTKWPWKFPTSFISGSAKNKRQRLKTSMDDDRETFSTFLLTPPKTFSNFYKLLFLYTINDAKKYRTYTWIA